jgi:hypothetical protein
MFLRAADPIVARPTFGRPDMEEARIEVDFFCEIVRGKDWGDNSEGLR